MDKKEREMQTVKLDSGTVLHFPKSLDGMEYIQSRAILFEGLQNPEDQTIADYQDKITRLLPIFCKHAEGSDGKEVEVNMALYEQTTPKEVDELFALMQKLWMESRATKKKSTKT